MVGAETVKDGGEVGLCMSPAGEELVSPLRAVWQFAG